MCDLCSEVQLLTAGSYLSSSNHLLGSIHSLSAAGTAVSTTHLLRHLGCVGIVGRLVGLGPVESRQGNNHYMSAGLYTVESAGKEDIGDSQFHLWLWKEWGTKTVCHQYSRVW